MSRRWLLTFGCATGIFAGVAGFQGRANAPANDKGTERKSTMSPASADFQLTVAASDRTGRLLPEQAVGFDVIFRNLSSQEEALASLTGNDGTPILRVFDASDKLLGKFDPGTRRRRLQGHQKFAPSTPSLAYLRAGVQDGTRISLWKYLDPLGPGGYSLQVSHQIRPGGPSIQAAPTRFEIVAARASSVAMNYGESDHSSSLLSWLSQPLDESAHPQVLIRLSAYDDHGLLMEGATPGGSVPDGAHLTSSALPPFSDIGDEGWLAVSYPGKIELIRHSLAQVTWRSGEIPVPIANLKPVLRFPDRGHALFLATGTDKGTPVLMGLRVEDDPSRNAAPPVSGTKLRSGPSAPQGVDDNVPLPAAKPGRQPAPVAAQPPQPKRDLPPYHPWTIPLKGEPARTAVAFESEGPVSILLVYDNQGIATLSRIDVDEAGRVVTPEAVIITSNRVSEIRAVAVDARKGQPLAFLALGSDPKEYNRLGLVRMPLAGSPKAQDFRSLPGWPSKTVNGQTILLAPTEIALEVAPDGRPWLALIDESGHLSGGVLDGSPLTLLRAEGRCSNPFIAALPSKVTPGCFTETGRLYPIGNHDH
jgi:hypothetical protein